jgi:hypothetical protein
MNEPVLMNEQNIEPILRVLRRPIQVNPPIRQLIHEPIIPDVSHPVQRKFGVSFLKEDRLDFETVFEGFLVVGCLAWEFHTTEVVD